MAITQCMWDVGQYCEMIRKQIKKKENKTHFSETSYCKQ